MNPIILDNMKLVSTPKGSFPVIRKIKPYQKPKQTIQSCTQARLKLSLTHSQLHCYTVKPAALHSIPIALICLLTLIFLNFTRPCSPAQNDEKLDAPNANPDRLIKRSGIIPKGIAPVPVSPSDPNAATWQYNPRKAFSLAKTKQKPMLLLFTAQWNTICQSLSSEVFSSKTFNLYAKEKLVICYLDFPRSPLDTSDALRKLKEKFKIRGLPVLLIFNSDGHVVDQITGYHSGRPVDYFNKIKTICEAQIADISQQRQALSNRGYREWENNKGQKFFAQFVSRDNSAITLKSASNDKWEIKIKSLCPADQAYAQSFPVSPSSKLK